MALTKVERAILMNQFRILSLIDKSDADTHKRYAEALAEGYSYEYEFLEHMSDGLTEDECRFVYDVLDMYDAMQTSFNNLKEKRDLKASQIQYKGFGGNEETEYMAYSRYIVEGGKFTYLDMNKDHNSHMQSIPGYQRMLEKWSEFKRSHELDADQLKAVVEASYYR
jgi:uncharacterized protein